MTLLVEYIYDDEVDLWGFAVPSLNLVGGMDATQEDAERHCLNVIADVLAGGRLAAPEGNVVVYDVQLKPAATA